MSYTIAYDTSSAPSKGRELVSFMEEFYATSDDPAAHEKYARSFTPDATLIMGPKVGKGYDGMWSTFLFFLIFFIFEPSSYCYLFGSLWK